MMIKIGNSSSDNSFTLSNNDIPKIFEFFLSGTQEKVL